MLTIFDAISVRQAFQVWTLASAISCVAAATKISLLAFASQYRPFLGVLSIWFTFCVLTLAVPISSKLYLQIYLIAAPLSWLLYLFVARDLYQKIFSKYRGIAFAGRWCLYVSGVILVAGGAASVWFSPARLKSGMAYQAVVLIDRSVLFGLSFFLVLLVLVIIRYPISIQRNLVVHTLVFSSILLCQSLIGAADQWTAYRYSMSLNVLIAAADTLLVSGWAVMVSTAGETIVVRIRHIKPELEGALLGQLDTLNGILLRAARK